MHDAHEYQLPHVCIILYGSKEEDKVWKGQGTIYCSAYFPVPDSLNRYFIDWQSFAFHITC